MLDDSDWETADPAALGVESELGDRLDRAQAAGELAGLHAVAVLRHGRPVLERYYRGRDERWGEPLGKVQFTPTTPHDVRSVSKSLVGLLYGIALNEGLVPSPQVPLIEALPDYADLAEEPARLAMTVGHALTMSLGIAWNEDLPYDDPRNSEVTMERAADRCRFVLEQPLDRAPGEAWRYCGGATALLARLIEDGSGLGLHDFARRRLFEPLGIERSEWVKGQDGRDVPASGCRLTARALVRLGELVLRGGKWPQAGEGEIEVVPASWLQASMIRYLPCDEGLAYGYHWWLSGPTFGLKWFSAFGNGGQRLQVFPALGLAIAILAGNYNSKDAWRLPVGIVTRFLLPALNRP